MQQRYGMLVGMSDPITIPPISTGELGSVTVFHVLRQVYPVAEARSRMLDGAEMVIGRGPGSGGFVIDDESSSRQHASIRFDGRTHLYHVIDLASRNGTFINGAPVERHALQNGDSLRIGRSILSICEALCSWPCSPRTSFRTLSLARLL